MMQVSWSQYVRSYRTVHRMKQDEMAAVINVRQPSVSRWEKGTMVPTVAEQIHYRAKLEEYARLRTLQRSVRPALVIPPTIRALLHASPASSLLDETITIRAVGLTTKKGFEQKGQSAIGARVLSLASENVHRVVAEWRTELFKPGSPVLSVSYDDLSILFDGTITRRTWTAVDIGEDRRLVFNVDNIMHSPMSDLPPLNLSVLTTEDLDDQ